LAGMSLSDSLTAPDRWFVPPKTLLAPQGFLKIRFDDEALPSSTNTGFGLRATGGSVYLFRPSTNGWELEDSVSYGLQAADWSIGRIPDGTGAWVLNQPTPARTN